MGKRIVCSRERGNCYLISSDLIRITEELIYQASHLKLRAIQHARTYGSVSDTTRNLQGKIFSEFKQSKITPPQTIRSLQDLNELFEPLKDYIGYVKDASKDQITLKQCLSSSESSDSLHEQMTQIGSIVKIKWKQEEVRGTGWKAGWYNAQVQSYNPDTDEIDVVYNQEPDCPCPEQTQETETYKARTKQTTTEEKNL